MLNELILTGLRGLLALTPVYKRELYSQSRQMGASNFWQLKLPVRFSESLQLAEQHLSTFKIISLNINRTTQHRDIFI